MSTFKGRALRAAIIASTITLMLAACSGGTGDSSNDAPAASAETSASASALAEEAPESGDSAATADFIENFGRGIDAMTTMSFTMDLAAEGQTMSSSGVVDNSVTPPQVSMEMTIPGIATPVQSVVIDGNQYMNMGEMSGNMWIKMDTATDPSLAASADPVQQLRAFRSAVTDVTEVGKEDVNGVDTTHYTVTVDTTKMTTDATSTAGLPPTMTYEIWLDGEGRTAKMVIDLTSAGVAGSTTMTFSKFGEPVTIVAPPADQITDMSTLG